MCGASLHGGSQPPTGPNADLATAERREATILFADLGGYTEFTGQADVEEVASVLMAIKEGASEIVRAYGGVVNQFVGDEVVAVFGLPYGHEDDPRRAVSTAIELHAFVRSSRITRLMGGRAPLVLHTGVDTGIVLAVSQDLREGLFRLTGNAVNFAARLRSLAERDEILISAATQRRVSSFFRTIALVPRSIKGVAETIVPYRVEAHGSARSSFDVALERGLTPYVGRRSELATLDNHLAEAGRGQARAVSLHGPPGVGKTRLIHEVATRAQQRGFCVLRGACQSYGNIPPFQPFLDTLRQAVGPPRAESQAPGDVVGRVLALDPNLAGHLPVYLYLLGLESPEWALPDALRGPLLRRAVCAALSALLLALAQKHPILVVIEDWHWADEASDSLLRELARGVRGQPIMALITYRSDQLPENRRPLSSHRIQLTHFGEIGTASFLRELLQSDALPDTLARYVHAVTDGNPFFIEEICQSLIDSGALVRSGPHWQLTRPSTELTTPSSVQAMVRARVDLLELSDKELLKLASVIGSEFVLDLLRPLAAPQSELGAGLQRLESRAHIQQLSPASYRFKHPIVHEVVYNVLLIKRRRELHGLIAHMIEERAAPNLEQHYEQLAHHYGRSEFRERAVMYAELAARKAERTFSLDQARRQYFLAIECLDELPATPELMQRRVDLSVRWATTHVHNPAPSQVAVLLRSLEYAKQLNDSRLGARCLACLGWAEYTFGNSQRSIEHNRRCLELLADGSDPRLYAQARLNLGIAFAMATDYDQAELYLADVTSVQHFEEGSNVAAGVGYALGHLGLLAADRGEFAVSRSHFIRARAAVEASGRYAMVGAVAVMEGLSASLQADWATAQMHARRVREVAERIDGEFQRNMAAMIDGLARVYGGADREALNGLRAVAANVEGRGMGLVLSWMLSAIAEAMWFAGDAQGTAHYAALALERRQVWDRLGEAAALRARALAKHAQGQAGAREDFEASLLAARRKRSQREELLTRWLCAPISGESVDDFAERFDRLQMVWHSQRAAQQSGAAPAPATGPAR